MKKTIFRTAGVCLLLLLTASTLHAQLSKYDESAYNGVFPVSGNALNMQGLSAVKQSAASKAIQEAGVVSLRSHLSCSMRWVKTGDSYALAAYVDAGLEQFSFKVPSADHGDMTAERSFSVAGISPGAWRITGIVLEITNSKGTFKKRVSFDLSGNWGTKGASLQLGNKAYTSAPLVSNKEAWEVYNLVNDHLQKKWDPAEPFFRYGYFKVTVISPGNMSSDSYPVAALKQYAANEYKKGADNIARLKQAKAAQQTAAATTPASTATTTATGSTVKTGTSSTSSTTTSTSSKSSSTATTGSSANSSSGSASPASTNRPATTSSASAANRQRVDANNAQIRQQANAISRQSDQTWNAYQNVLRQTQNMFKVDEATRRQREAEEAADEREWEEEQRRRRREEARREREKQQQEEERRERQRIADEKAREEAAARDAKRQADYAVWQRNGKAAFDKAYKNWQQEDIKVVSELLRTYPKLTIDAIRDFDKLMAIPSLTTADKSAIIKSVTLSISQYRNLHRQYNFYGEIPGYSSQTPRMQYLKALDGFDPRAATSHHDYISTRPDKTTANPVMSYSSSYQKNWNTLKSALHNNRNAIRQLKAIPSNFNYMGTFYYPDWNFRTKRASRSNVSMPYRTQPLLPAHVAFLEDFIRQAYDLPRDPNKNEYDHVYLQLAKYYHEQQSPGKALHHLLTILSNNNLSSLPAFIDLPVARRHSDNLFTYETDYNNITRQSDSRLTEKTRAITGNAAFILYQNGYLDESTTLFSQAMATFTGEQTGSGFRADRRETWKYPGASGNYAYWEYYSWLLKCQYLQGKKELVLQNGKLFLDKMKAAFNKTTDDILRSTIISRRKADIHSDHLLYQTYLRGIAYYARVLHEKGDKKAAEKILKPHLKAYNKDKDFTNFAGSTLTDIQETLQAVYTGTPDKTTLHATLPAQPQTASATWDTHYSTQIKQVRQHFGARQYDSVVTLCAALRGTLHPAAIQPAATTYIETMNLAALASLYTNRYQDGISFASFGPVVDTALATPEVLRILNALMLCKTHHPLHHYKISHQITEAKQLNTQRYYLERALIRYASTRHNGRSGYEELEDIARELAARGITSPYLVHLFNAIGFGTKNLAGR